MTPLTLYNRPREKTFNGEKFRSPTFRAGEQPWYKRLRWKLRKISRIKIL